MHFVSFRVQNSTFLFISCSASLPGFSTPSLCLDFSTSRLKNQSFPGLTGSVSHAFTPNTSVSWTHLFHLSTCSSFLLSTGAVCAACAGHHCSNISGAGAHHRQTPDWIPLRDFICPQRSAILHPPHSLQVVPGTDDQANSLPAAHVRGLPSREKPVKFVNRWTFPVEVVPKIDSCVPLEETA